MYEEMHSWKQNQSIFLPLLNFCVEISVYQTHSSINCWVCTKVHVLVMISTTWRQHTSEPIILSVTPSPGCAPALPFPFFFIHVQMSVFAMVPSVWEFCTCVKSNIHMGKKLYYTQNTYKDKKILIFTLVFTLLVGAVFLPRQTTTMSGLVWQEHVQVQWTFLRHLWRSLRKNFISQHSSDFKITDSVPGI